MRLAVNEEDHSSHSLRLEARRKNQRHWVPEKCLGRAMWRPAFRSDETFLG